MVDACMVPRPALSQPETSQLQLQVVFAGSVSIRHPGRLGATLFAFPAYSHPDPTDSSGRRSGLYHLLALDACRIVTNYAANNRGDFLARDREGKTPVPIDDVSLLTYGNYYYFLGPPEVHANCNYPIIKSFSAFVFPSQLPDNWYTARTGARWQQTLPLPQIVSSTNMSIHVVTRDECCTATKYREFTQCAHLVPRAEAAWFIANDMRDYSGGNERARVNAHTNGISLRDDVHRCLESHAFVFYPAGKDQFMTYFVSPRGYPNYTELLHQRLVTIHPNVAIEFLYARFAYAVIHLVLTKEAFESVPDNPRVKVWEELLALSEARKRAQKAAKLAADGEESPTSKTSASEHPRIFRSNEDPESESPVAPDLLFKSPPGEPLAEGDARWRDRLLARFPQFATLDEVEYPPEGVSVHMETPHMLRLRSKYMQENPQVWQTSTTPEGSTRGDEEGLLARWMTRPT
ncbi:hypothetical protein GSI_05137 [Ganoderma sinense ZZ0214-1]|uniref:HNH nuclease domain-containing protein n=1 Tax=Ganoderma sinense ZZ0214-1 TaxID=1077348 RepID=A0A2G8SF77_9APHY|nr:hypothetical protein GSI_05137 [Ganoderma sinense ZZ0214-1]